MEPEAIIAEALRLSDAGRAGGIPLRLIGSLAISLRAPTHRHLSAELGRRTPQDVDFVAYARDAKRLATLFDQHRYVIHPAVSHSQEWGIKRLIYTHGDNGLKVDVFLDQLVMAHTIDFAGTLEGSHVTVSLADLLLSKLQIYRITRNDLVDLIVLLAEHGLGDGPDAIDRRRLQVVLGADWGFWYGALRSLDALEAESELHDKLPPELRERVAARAREIRQAIVDAPTTLRWRMRARIGTKRPWYEDVEDVAL